MFKVVVKVTLSLAVLTGVFLAYGLKQPPIFIFNQTVNRALSTNAGGLAGSVAKLLVKLEIADDWSKPISDLERLTTFPLLSFAGSAQNSYPYQIYDKSGRPSELERGPFTYPEESAAVFVSSTQEILSAIEHAKPGQVITISPGVYDIKAHAISVNTAGLPSAPIYLRAATFGTVTLHMNTHEGFHISQPFWVFENLKIRGECSKHSYCEHAFHVVGNGRSFTLRNNELSNFNAPIKANLKSINGTLYYPEYGLVEYNSFYNQEPRATNNPVTLLNINSTDGWVVRGNFIADFSKNGGDGVSYGAFMKGNSRNGIFERNLVMCEHRIPADEGIRVGLSFGGGGTGTKYCKEQDCSVEHRNGIMRNNIIMNCSRDVGIYLNRAQNSKIYHNLLYNNLGIDVRFETSTAQIDNNIISGRIKNRDAASSSSSNNIVARDCIGTTLTNCSLRKLYAAPEEIDFRLTNLDNDLWKPLQSANETSKDFCGRPITREVNPGPIQYFSGIDCMSGPAR